MHATATTATESPGAPDAQAARRIAEGLSDSAWALGALSAAAEYGLIEHLDRARRAHELAEACGLPSDLVTRLLDVLGALGLVTREGSLYAASPGMAQAIAMFPDILPAFARTHLLQLHDLYGRARAHRLGASGWHHRDVDLLQAHGAASAGFAPVFEHVLLDGLDGLRERLRRPGARFLDVGAGVAGISIALCRRFRSLSCLALEPAEAPRALARDNIQRAGLGTRIELRQQRVEQLEDVERFDLAWLPVPFLAPAVVPTALANVWRALRPGGWALVASVSTDGEQLGPAVARLRCALWGGAPLADETLEAMLEGAGFTDIRSGAQLPVAKAPTQARKPPAG